MEQCATAKHLGQEELQDCVMALHNKTILAVLEVQKQFLQDSICESDFLTVLVNYAIKTAVNVIRHLELNQIPKKEAMDMVLGSAINSLGEVYISNAVPVPDTYGLH